LLYLTYLTFCRFLWYELFVYLIWLLSFVAFTLLFEREDPGAPLPELLGTPEGAATVAMSLVSLTAMVPFLYMEVRTVLVMYCTVTSWL
jgi:hypothetical protein